MNDASILAGIFALTGAETDEKALAAVAPVGPLSALAWVRVTRVSSFWIRPEGRGAVASLQDTAGEFVTGLSGQGAAWAFLVVGYADHLEVWYGAHLHGVDRQGFCNALRSAYPDIRLDVTRAPNWSELGELSHQCVFTGAPSNKQKEGEGPRHFDQIEKVCRALYGGAWAFVVAAEKVGHPAIIRELNQTTAEIRTTHATFLNKQNAADEHNKTAERYVELLQQKLERWELGRSVGMWKYRSFLMCSDRARLTRGAAIVRSAFAGEDSSQSPFRGHFCSHDGLKEWADSMVNSVELGLLSRFPSEEYSGFEVVPEVRFGVEPNQAFVPGDDIVRIGAILDRGQPVGRDLSIRRADLTKHGIIVGVTGAGKTNTCFSLLEQVWMGGKGVPFLVIESAKSEYRALLKSPRFQGLRVFTAGDETISPLRINPFEVPKGILVQSHIDYLQALFGAAFVLYPPMPYVLAMSIQRVYEEKGWNLSTNRNERGEGLASCFPTLDDLVQTVRRVSDGMGYEGEIRANIKAGLEGRLNQLRIGGGKGAMLNCRESLSADDLFGSPCILELKQLVSDEEKAFLIGLLLIRLYEHYESKGHSGDGRLKHVTLIEEAHRLLKNVSTQQGGDTANPQGKAIEVFANLLAEIRAFGEGIFMAEQIPTKLASEAIKNTNLKVVHRLVAKDDRETVGATMNLSEEQMAALSTLRCGQAVAFLEGMQKPALLQIPETETKKRYEQLTSSELCERMRPFWAARPTVLLRHGFCGDCPSKGAYCAGNLGVSEPIALRLQFLWSGIRFYPEDVPKYWRALCDVFLASAPSAGQHDPICVASAWMVNFINQRGQHQRWPIRAVDEVASELSGLLRALNGSGDAKALLGRLSGRIAALDREHGAKGPHVGCDLCPTRCLFAYEVKHSVGATNPVAYAKVFNEYSDEAIQLAFETASRWGADSSDDHRVGTAFCHVVTSLAATGARETATRRKLISMLDALRAKAIARATGNPKEK